jgi:Ca-activated chloride channel family protein
MGSAPRAASLASDRGEELAEFSKPDTADAFFLQGNGQARLGKYEAAIEAYDNALLKRRDFPQATANRALVAALIPKPDDSEAEQAPDLKPDELEFDNQKDKGKEVKIDAAMLRKQTAELWMRNLQVSPADFLRQKFRIEADEAGAAAHD